MISIWKSIIITSMQSLYKNVHVCPSLQHNTKNRSIGHNIFFPIIAHGCLTFTHHYGRLWQRSHSIAIQSCTHNRREKKHTHKSLLHKRPPLLLCLHFMANLLVYKKIWFKAIPIESIVITFLELLLYVPETFLSHVHTFS